MEQEDFIALFLVLQARRLTWKSIAGWVARGGLEDDDENGETAVVAATPTTPADKAEIEDGVSIADKTEQLTEEQITAVRDHFAPKGPPPPGHIFHPNSSRPDVFEAFPGRWVGMPLSMIKNDLDRLRIIVEMEDLATTLANIPFGPNAMDVDG
ncbi:hypothetical protein B0T17DRAFT_505028 [Bombardia bombarda]|uniref:Uncharacterized protein n=1 Tax=Bombardia bombarda TaxID=252184 RepID=A0AA39X6R9_9PEZI|nr:hypothetical protein B0T17DRAFT_505028 [Bombardia bombarda]